MRVRDMVWLCSWVMVMFAVVPVLAQTDPRTLPRVQASDMVLRGTFLVPTGDGAYGFTWSRALLGIAADGQSLYISCDGDARAARVSIPAAGGISQVLDGCKGPSNLSAVDPGSDVNGYALGGVLDLGGTVVVTGFSYYDGNYDAVASHWSGPSLSALTGPVKPASPWNAGWFAGAMGPVPAEWQGLLGGAWLTGQHSLSTLPRTSFGPSVSTFGPRNLTAPATVLMGCDEAHQATCYGQWDAANPIWSGVSKGSGFAAIPGTRSILYALRHARTYCYGPGAACGDPTNPNQGNHGYPYFHEIAALDLSDAADVVAGRKAFHQVKPYTSWELPGIGKANESQPLTMAFDPATRRAYLMEHPEGRQPVVYVYEITVGSTPPPPPPPVEVCGNGVDDDGDGQVDEGCAPPANPCADNPITLTVSSWMGIAEGGRSAAFSWSVPNVVATVQRLVVDVANGRAVSLELTDSRGCTAKVVRP